MSIVLDALRRSQSLPPAAPPALGTLPSRDPAPDAPLGGRPSAGPGGVLLGGAVAVTLLALAVALVLAWRQVPAVPPNAAPPIAAPHTIATTTAAPPPAPASNAAATLPATPRTVLQAAAPRADAPPSVERPARALPVGGVALPAPPSPSVAAAPPPPPATVPATPAAPPSPAGAATPLERLPEELRRQFPPLAIGGSIWSDDPASRFVLVGGQVVREGDAAAPGVVVDRIAPRSIVLRWQGQRVELALP